MSFALHLRVAGTGLVVLALLHAAFPRRFNWKEELPRLSLLNRQMFLVHCFFIAAMLTFFGVLSFVLARDLATPSPLSKAVLLGFAVFWLLRLFVQLFVYDPRLWRGHALHTTLHVAFTVFWVYLVAVYGGAFWAQIGHRMPFVP